MATTRLLARPGFRSSAARGGCFRIGPYQGKQTGETALLRDILDCVQEGNVVVFDRCYCSYMMIAAIVARRAHVCVRRHQCRPVDFSVGQPLGQRDRLVTWLRPQRPAWQSTQEYDHTPQTLTLRELQFDIFEPGSREETITVVTTMTDPVAFPKEQVAGLYGYRWNSELDIRDIKRTLRLDHARCKTPEMVHRELWVKLLAYNLIRKVIATAACSPGGGAHRRTTVSARCTRGDRAVPLRLAAAGTVAITVPHGPGDGRRAGGR